MGPSQYGCNEACLLPWTDHCRSHSNSISVIKFCRKRTRATIASFSLLDNIVVVDPLEISRDTSSSSPMPGALSHMYCHVPRPPPRHPVRLAIPRRRCCAPPPLRRWRYHGMLVIVIEIVQHVVHRSRWERYQQRRVGKHANGSADSQSLVIEIVQPKRPPRDLVRRSGGSSILALQCLAIKVTIYFYF